MPVSVRTAMLMLVVALAVGMGIGVLTLPPGEPADSAAGGSSATESPNNSPGDSEADAVGLTAAADKQTIAVHERLTISGQLTPPENGVRLVVQRMDGGNWQAFPASTTTGRDGSYSVWIKSGRRGENTYRLSRPDDGTASAEVTVTVK